MSDPTRDGNAVDGCGFLTLEEIDALVHGKLDPDRRRRFDEHALAGCDECAMLAADAATYRAVHRTGADEEERAEFETLSPMLAARLRRELRSRHLDRGKESPALKRWALGTVAALLAGVTLLAVFQISGPSAPGSTLALPDGSVMIVHPMPFSKPPVVRGGPAPETIWRQAEAAYAGRRFARAAELLSEIGEDDPHAADATLYRGVSLLMVGEPAEAREILERARRIAEREGLPESAALWYSGLAALADGDPAAARSALTAARDAGGAYAERAADLLPRLETD